MNKEKSTKSEMVQKNDEPELLLEFLSNSQESVRSALKYPDTEIWLAAPDVGREIID